MATDHELYVRWKTEYPELTQAQAAEFLASEYLFSPDSVRGRLQRGDTPSSRMEVARYLATNLPTEDKSYLRQQEVIERSLDKFNATRLSWSTGLFLSDLHAPYCRWDAVELLYTITEALKPDVWTGQNDLLDNAGYSRWDENRTIRGRQWASDGKRNTDWEINHYQTMRKLSGGVGVQVLGNHDKWRYRHKREVDPQDAEMQIADYMERLEQDGGLLQFSNGIQENAVHVAPNLVWWHGQYAHKSALTNARSTIKKFIVGGVASSVMVGHTHRAAHISGHNFDIPGVNFYNSGCLCRLDDIPYMASKPDGWELGIYYCHFDQRSRYERCEYLGFYEDGNNLVAYVEGKKFSVRLDKRVMGN